MEKSSYQLLLDYAFRILGIKSYSEAEMKKKLALKAKRVKMADSEALIQKILERLKELAYLNDEKILDDFFEYKLKAKPQGKFLFLMEVRRRGISREKAEQKWHERGISEKDLARELLERKANQLKKYPPEKRKEKAARLLASRGFSGEVIWDIVL